MIGQVVDATLEVLGTGSDGVPRTEAVPIADGGLSRPFTALEEMLANLDTAEFPWTVQVEARVGGTIDARRLRGAVAVALRRHPMGLARRRPHGLLDTSYVWEQASGPDLDPVVELRARHDADHAVLRGALLSSRICIDAAPLLRVWLVHRPGGDSLILSVSHVMADGLGALRLLRSIAAAMAGDDDGTEPVPHAEALTHLGPGSLIDRALSLGGFLTANPVRARSAARVAVEVEPDDPGTSFRLDTVTVDASGLSARRHADATINDLLVAALHLAIEDWNADHAVETGRIGVMMPVNLRPAEWRDEVVVNLASMASVSTGEAERETPGSLLDAVSRQTRRVKTTGAARALDDVLGRSGPLPVGVKRFLPVLLPLTGDRLVDTAVLSNLGRVDPIDFGLEAGPSTELWFSPPARMPLGVGVGAVTVDGSLRLSFRSCREQFSAEAATSFADRYRQALEFLG